ncbi:CLUMA_CG020202, isoform A [Clunio marinus]|uniref:CLUMA_CG020202, isoform A n=1 Tax=Clunio marinus TaxID=568069 RepID=A0A1J1J485_9DIPT|nr:CLUMA_CG020202, isoform A [Clunio marinus]
MGLFGRSNQKNPSEMVKEWNGKLRKEGYALDRQVRSIKREEDKIKKSLKEAAKKNDKQVCTILAKEMVRSRKAVNRIYASKAQLSSVQLQMQQQLATLKVSGSLQKSTEVMQAMQRLVRLPEISNTMREMSREMTKAGILEEMIEETMESLEDSEEIEEEAQSEVDKVLWELTDGKLGEAPSVPISTPSEPAAASKDEESGEEDLEEMRNRLEALRS